MHLGIKNFVGGAKKYLFGDGSYSQNIIQGGSVLQPQPSYQPGDIMPTATADVSGSWTYSSSGAYSVTPAYAAANDTSPGSCPINYTTWNSSGGGPCWWQAAKNDSKAETIAKYTIAANSYNPLRTPTAFQLWGSNTGDFSGEHTVLDSQSGVSWTAGEKKTFTLAAQATFLYFRIYMTAYGYGGDGYYNLGEVEFLPPARADCIVITGAATVAPDATTGASVFTAENIVVNGGTLSPSTNSKGLIGIVSGYVRLVNGGRIHIDKLGKAGNFGNLTVLDLVPQSLKSKLKPSLASYLVLGEGAAGAAAFASRSTNINGVTGSSAAAMQTGGGGSGGFAGNVTVPSYGGGGKGGPCCGGAGGGGLIANYAYAGVAGGAHASNYGGPGGPASNDWSSYGTGGGAGNPAGTSGPYNPGTPPTCGGGLLMLFAPTVSIDSGCVISADGGPGGTAVGSLNVHGAGAGGGCVCIGTLSGGYSNAGTVRANGGAGQSGQANSGAGGAGSVNTFAIVA